MVRQGEGDIYNAVFDLVPVRITLPNGLRTLRTQFQAQHRTLDTPEDVTHLVVFHRTRLEVVPLVIAMISGHVRRPVALGDPDHVSNPTRCEVDGADPDAFDPRLHLGVNYLLKPLPGNLGRAQAFVNAVGAVTHLCDPIHEGASGRIGESRNILG